MCTPLDESWRPIARRPQRTFCAVRAALRRQTTALANSAHPDNAPAGPSVQGVLKNAEHGAVLACARCDRWSLPKYTGNHG